MLLALPNCLGMERPHNFVLAEPRQIHQFRRDEALVDK